MTQQTPYGEPIITGEAVVVEVLREDGSIAELTQWRPVARGDVIFVPAGTIHAIGAGIVLAEIQQRSDATFRLFDYGRHRELPGQLEFSAVNDA